MFQQHHTQTPILRFDHHVAVNNNQPQHDDQQQIVSSQPTIGNFRVKTDRSILFPQLLSNKFEPKMMYDTNRYTYYEVKLCEPVNCLNVGFGFSSIDDHKCLDVVGWDEHTIGFHFDNGRVYQETSYTAPIAQKVFLTHVTGRDEVFGFLLDHENGEFKVTQNGRVLENALGTKFTKEEYRKKNFKPMASCRCADNQFIEWEINLGLDLVKKPFMFTDIICVKQREKLLESISTHSNKNFSDVSVVCQE